MIYTITLNPALDHFLDVPELQIDDANRVASECLYAGGKGIDVSRAIRRLGSDSMALGFIGGHNGQIMVDLLKKEGVTCYFTPIAQETRRNLIIGTIGRGTQTMLNSRGPGKIVPASPPPPARRRHWHRAINSAGCGMCNDWRRSSGSNISGHMERNDA